MSFIHVLLHQFHNVPELFDGLDNSRYLYLNAEVLFLPNKVQQIPSSVKTDWNKSEQGRVLELHEQLLNKLTMSISIKRTDFIIIKYFMDTRQMQF